MRSDPKHAANMPERDAAQVAEPRSTSSARSSGSYDPGSRVTGDPADIPSGTLDHVPDGDVIDVEGVVRMLRVGRNKLYEMVARNEIPHRRFGRTIRFSRAAIMRWLDSWSSQGAKEGQ